MSRENWKRNGFGLHDRAEAESLEEGEVGGIGKSGPENAIVDHGEVQRRYEEILAVIGSSGAGGGGDDVEILRRR